MGHLVQISIEWRSFAIGITSSVRIHEALNQSITQQRLHCFHFSDLATPASSNLSPQYQRMHQLQPTHCRLHTVCHLQCKKHLVLSQIQNSSAVQSKCIYCCPVSPLMHSHRLLVHSRHTGCCALHSSQHFQEVVIFSSEQVVVLICRASNSPLCVAYIRENTN